MQRVKGLALISFFSLFLAEDGHDPNEKYEDLEGQGAIHAAAAIGNLPIVHILLQVSKVRLMIQVGFCHLLPNVKMDVIT